jgi:septum site-determining protein MinC
MIAKQKNLRIFELFVEDDESFINYMDKNLLLLKDYLLLVNGKLTPTMREYLQDKGCCYKEIDGCKIKLRAKEIKKERAQEKIEIVHYVQDEQEIEKNQNTKVIKTPVRSGTIVEYDGDITIFNRVNSGAKVICGGNLSVFGLIDGVVECDGEYMILQEIGKGFAVFNGDIIEKELLDGKLKKISSTEDGLLIEDLV